MSVLYSVKTRKEYGINLRTQRRSGKAGLETGAGGTPCAKQTPVNISGTYVSPKSPDCEARCAEGVAYEKVRRTGVPVSGRGQSALARP